MPHFYTPKYILDSFWTNTYGHPCRLSLSTTSKTVNNEDQTKIQMPSRALDTISEEHEIPDLDSPSREINLDKEVPQPSTSKLSLKRAFESDPVFSRYKNQTDSSSEEESTVQVI